jgi:hypothetical protein
MVLSQDSRSLGQNSKPEILEIKAEVFIIQLARSARI